MSVSNQLISLEGGVYLKQSEVWPVPSKEKDGGVCAEPSLSAIRVQLALIRVVHRPSLVWATMDTWIELVGIVESVNRRGFSPAIWKYDSWSSWGTSWNCQRPMR